MAMTALVEGIGASAERKPVHLKEEIQLKDLLACLELAVGVGLGRKLEARLRVEEPGTAARTDPRWVHPDMRRELRIQEGTTKGRRVASRPVEVSEQRFESSGVSIAVASAAESSYDRQWTVLSHLVEQRRRLWHVDLYDKATGEDGGL